MRAPVFCRRWQRPLMRRYIRVRANIRGGYPCGRVETKNLLEKVGQLSANAGKVLSKAGSFSFGAEPERCPELRGRVVLLKIANMEEDFEGGDPKRPNICRSMIRRVRRRGQELWRTIPPCNIVLRLRRFAAAHKTCEPPIDQLVNALPQNYVRRFHVSVSDVAGM